jgi:molybdopterin converting factor small subunit
MARVTVRYFGPIRGLARHGDDVFELPAGATVRELFQAIGARRGQAFLDEIALPSGEPLPTVTVLVDGRNVLHGGGLDAPIGVDGLAQVLILPPPFEGG